MSTTQDPTTHDPRLVAVGERPAVAPSRVAQRDWGLWVDWCAATSRDPHQVEIGDLVVFLLELPATTGVQDRRVRNIARALGRAGRALPRPTTAAANGPAVRTGPGWATHPDALAALRQEWYPEGVAARRDALILVLTAAGFTRRRIATLRSTQITTTPSSTVGDGAGVTVDGVDLPRTADPMLCPRCALTRWAQVLDAFADRSRYDVEDLLSAARDHTRPHHDCTNPRGDRWRSARWIMPAIDRHGAMQPTSPLTGRALTGILARRYNPAAVRAATTANQPAPRPTQPALAPSMRHRPGREDHAELEKLWEQADKAADELNARILRLLDDL